MVVMGQKKVERYLDDLLVTLESTGNKDVMEDIIKTVNYYQDTYHFDVKKYASVGNRIIEEIENRER